MYKNLRSIYIYIYIYIYYSTFKFDTIRIFGRICIKIAVSIHYTSSCLVLQNIMYGNLLDDNYVCIHIYMYKKNYITRYKINLEKYK